jgi:hypothetical protein
MKNLLIIGIIFLTLGCNKQNCKCGTVVNDGIEIRNHSNCYWLEVENSCTNNIDKFCVEERIWKKTYVGDPFCLKGKIDIW